MPASGSGRGWLVVAAVFAATAACGGDDGSSKNEAAPAADLTRGGEVYRAKCAECHGADLRGTAKGPSQLSKVYEPSHHADGAYRRAVQFGARAHHWNFGDMPPVEGLSEADVEAVIAFIRSEQNRQGFESYRP